MKFLLIILTLTLASDVALGQSDPPRGTVIEAVKCEQDPQQSYALYLPGNYTEDKKWPVIFVFEPAARGPLPVRQFAPVAEELGYIIIASNNSRNGSWSIAFDAAEAIFTEARNKFKIDSSRIYTSGFSGGSRVAISMAVINSHIGGVIGCGAGLPNISQYRPTSASSFSYVGLVGNKDMNYQEHLELEKVLDDLGIANNRIVFEGKHQWPPSRVLWEAVYWLEYQAEKRGKSVSKNFDSDTLFERVMFRGDSLLKKERLVQALHVYEQAEFDFSESEEIGAIKDRLTEIKSEKKLKKYLRRDARFNESEQKFQTKIIKAFAAIPQTRLQVTFDSTAKTKAWWMNTVDSLHLATRNRNIDKSNSSHRLLNLIWAKFAESSFHYEEIKDYEMAVLLTEIWLHADPESVWGLWSMAKLQALVGDSSLAIDYLEKAHESGMKYKGSLRAPAFNALRDDPRFISLESRLTVQK
jgi:tetratricopeptide (TPR) repeat protein